MRIKLRDKAFPSNERKLKELAIELASKKKYKDAINCYRRILVTCPNDLYSFLKLCNTYMAAGLRDEALRAYSTLVRLYIHDGQIPKAIATYRMMYKIKPSVYIEEAILQLQRESSLAIQRPIIELVWAKPRDSNAQYWGGTTFDSI